MGISLANVLGAAARGRASYLGGQQAGDIERRKEERDAEMEKIRALQVLSMMQSRVAAQELGRDKLDETNRWHGVRGAQIDAAEGGRNRRFDAGEAARTGNAEQQTRGLLSEYESLGGRDAFPDFDADSAGPIALRSMNRQLQRNKTRDYDNAHPAPVRPRASSAPTSSRLDTSSITGDAPPVDPKAVSAAISGTRSELGATTSALSRYDSKRRGLDADFKPMQLSTAGVADSTRLARRASELQGDIGTLAGGQRARAGLQPAAAPAPKPDPNAGTALGQPRAGNGRPQLEPGQQAGMQAEFARAAAAYKQVLDSGKVPPDQARKVYERSVARISAKWGQGSE